jgi:hypothetical protein
MIQLKAADPEARVNNTGVDMSGKFSFYFKENTAHFSYKVN